MDKLKYIKFEESQGQYTNSIPIGVDSKNVDLKTGYNLEETLGDYDLSQGTIEERLKKTNVDKTLTQQGIAAEAKAVGDAIDILEKKKPTIYPTTAEMITDNKLAIGSVVQTLGYSNINDGKTTTYQIVPIKPTTPYETLNNGLYAKIISNKEEIYKVINIASKERALCVALVDPQKHAILFDLSDETNANGVINALNGIINIDAVCLSHYHHDHLGDYKTIFEALPHENCKWFIPQRPNASFFPDLANIYDTFKKWLDSNSQEYRTPSENETVEIQNVKITFNNCNPSYWYNHYSIEEMNYNWTCITAFVEFGKSSMQIMGDLYGKAEKYFFDTLKAGRKAQIYQAPHHGLTSKFNLEGFLSIAPEVVLFAYGTNNDYIPTIPYSTALADYCVDANIPCFDTYQNGTFEIIVCGNKIFYENSLKPTVISDTIKNYASSASALTNNFDIFAESDTLGLIDLLSSMPKNSSITMRVASNYKIITDLGLSQNCILKIYKFVGGNSNYLWDRTYPESYIFTIDIYEERTYPCHWTIYGRYSSNKFITYINTDFPTAICTFNGKKSSLDDTEISMKRINSRSNNDLINVNEDGNIIINRTGLYEVCFYPSSQATTADINFNNYTFHIEKGFGLQQPMQIASGTYNITSSSQTTNTINGYIKFISYYDSTQPSFPE